MFIEFFSSFLQFDYSLDNAQVRVVGTSGMALIFVVLSCCGAWFVRGSTAVPAALWSAAASTAFAMTILQQATVELDVATMGIYRVVFAALSVCPVMSLLGAKRPQYGVWQFIVGSLAAVLALPAVSAVLTHPGALPNLHILGRCFLPVLVIVGWMNFVGTRRAVAATLIAAGHLGLIWPLLPGVEFEAALPQTTRDLMSISSITAGGFIALIQAVLASFKRGRVSVGGVQMLPDNEDFVSRINTCFFALRETLGAAWTLRLAERFDSLATRRGWPVRLTFQGMRIQEEPEDSRWQADTGRAMEALMKRFVSSSWLRRHGWERFSV